MLDDEKYDQNSKDNIIRENWNKFIPNINAQSLCVYKGVYIRICILLEFNWNSANFIFCETAESQIFLRKKFFALH